MNFYVLPFTAQTNTTIMTYQMSKYSQINKAKTDRGVKLKSGRWLCSRSEAESKEGVNNYFPLQTIRLRRQRGRERRRCRRWMKSGEEQAGG